MPNYNLENNMNSMMDSLISQTVRDEYSSVVERSVENDNLMYKSIVENYVESLEIDDWNLSVDNGKIVIDEDGDIREFLSYSDAYYHYKDDIITDIQNGIIDDKGYYQFYLNKEQIYFMDMGNEYETQTMHMIEGIRPDDSYEYLQDDIVSENEQSQNSNRVVDTSPVKETTEAFSVNKNPKHDGFKSKFSELASLIDSQLSIVDIAREIGFNLEKNGSTSYKTKEHSSLVLDVKKNWWYWNSQGKKGSIVSFWMEFKNVTFKEAVNTLMERIDIEHPERYVVNTNVSEKRVDDIDRHKLISQRLMEENFSSDKNKAMLQVRAYLTKTRQIDKEIVEKMIAEKMIFQTSDEQGRTKAVFVGRNEDGLMVAACQRSTSSESKFKGDLADCCNYKKGWFYDPQFDLQRRIYNKDIKPNPNKTLLCFESNIEMMSYMSLLKLSGKDYNRYAYIACSSISKSQCILETCKLYGYKKSYVMFNNDFEKENNPGLNRACEVAELLNENGIDGRVLVPSKMNDWNDTLIAYRNKELQLSMHHQNDSANTVSGADKMRAMKKQGSRRLSEITKDSAKSDSLVNRTR